VASSVRKKTLEYRQRLALPLGVRGTENNKQFQNESQVLSLLDGAAGGGPPPFKGENPLGTEANLVTGSFKSPMYSCVSMTFPVAL